MRALAERSNARVDVVTWSRSGMGDLLTSSDRLRALREIRPDYVLHLAWESTEREHYELGIEHQAWSVATTQFARESMAQGARVAVAGSAADVPGDTSYASPYGDAKRAIRSALAREIEEGAVVWLRPQYLVSVAERRPRVVREYLTQRSSGPFHLRSPDAMFDFVEVRDAADALVLTIHHDLHGVIDLGSGQLHSVRQLIAGVSHYVGVRSDSQCQERHHLVGMDMSRFSQLGWRPRYTEQLLHPFGVSMSS